MKKNENVEEKQEETRKSNSKKKLIIFICILIVILTLVGVGLYYYFNFIYYTGPSNISTNNINLHNAQISWDASDKVDGYKVITSLQNFSKEEICEKLKNGTLEDMYNTIQVDNKDVVELSNLLCNTDYYYIVVPFKNNNDSVTYLNTSDVLKLHTNSLEISKVSDFKAESITNKELSLKWSKWTTEEKNADNTDIEIMYSIFSVNTENNESTEIASNIKENSFKVSDLKPLTTYFYKITAQAKIDNQTITGKESDILEVTSKPNSVLDVKAKSSSTSSITVSWKKYDTTGLKNKDNSNVSVTYKVYGCDSKDGKFKELKKDYTKTSFTESKLASNKTRYYYVTATITMNDKKYESVKSKVVSAKTKNSTPTYTTPTYTTPTHTSPTNSNTSASSKEAQARAVARQIASSITGSTDLEKVSAAAAAVSGYYYRGVHKETGNDYYTAYGVFIKGESSCAGCCRALGMVLSEMGYSWKHVNENLWTHQWLTVTMDGKTGWADGQIGMAGYGSHAFM